MHLSQDSITIYNSGNVQVNGDNLTFSSGAGVIKNGTNDLTLPSQSGTIAVISDIPRFVKGSVFVPQLTNGQGVQYQSWDIIEVLPETSGTSTLTRDQADQLYLQYPIGQGQETLPVLSTTGQVNVGTALSVGADIALNSTFPYISASANSNVLNIRTIKNGATIHFGVQSTTGTEFPTVIQLIASPKPTVFMNANETQIVDSTNSNFKTLMHSQSGQTTIKNIGTGTGGITLDASTSTAGAGAITLTTKNGTAGSGGGLILTGNTLEATTAGMSANRFLSITINGVVYKIALLNNV